ncbi:MAG: alpha/beta fold hydrolase [Clostridia bacterium]|nr:alpha/beta fold hydrolase [Clostridia bacterium]
MTPVGTLIVFIHGICGSGAQMASLAAGTARAGEDTLLLTLPGHGGDTDAFVRAVPPQWRDAVDTVVRENRERYRRVVLVGHSLGALLAFGAAARGGVDGIVALGTPMGMRTGWFQIRMGLRVALGNPCRDDPVVRVYREARGVTVRGAWDYLRWLRVYVRLLREVGRTRRLLGDISCPILLIQSDRDEAVSRRSAERIAGALRGPVRIVRLPRSRHAWTEAADKEIRDRAIREFIDGLGGTGDGSQAEGSTQFSEKTSTV